MSVHDIFVEAGFQAIKFIDACSPGSKDTEVARRAMLNKAVLIAVDKDMKKLTGRYGSEDPKFQKLNLIKIACSEPMAAKRLQQVMPLLQLEWGYKVQNKGRRLYVEVAQHWVRTYR